MTYVFPWNGNRLPKQIFINNEYVDSRNDKKLEVFNPKNESIIATDVPLAGEEDVDAAVDAAAEAFKTWRKTSGVQRRTMLLKLADLIEANKEALACLSRISMGAPFTSMGGPETDHGIEAIRYFAGWADKYAGESYPQDDGFLKIVRNEPLGVCVGIVPWNAPMATIGMKLGPALATGNTFILKPSEKTPFGALALASLVKEAGFPPGVFQVLSGDGSTGALLASHMRVAKVSFTGSTTTGRRIQEMSAKSNLKRVTLELGGKSPAVVFDDANIDNAVQSCVNAITANTGQICAAASRVYVQEGIYDRFVEAYKTSMEARAKGAGDPDSADTMMGPVVDKIQYDRIMGFLDRGKQQGKLVTGGGRLGEEGYYVQPTIFENPGQDAEITREEIFGPVSVIHKFKTEEEVIGKANDTHYGLMAGVFTSDMNKALRFASDIDAGMCGINAISANFINAPFGGSKMSGIGRENSMEALRMHTDKKTVFINMTTM